VGLISVTKPLENTQQRDVATMARMTKYTTKLTENKRVILEKEMSMNCPSLSYAIKSPDDAVHIGKEFMHIHEEPEEYLYMICMNTKNRVIGVFEISHGTVNASLVTPREVFQKALLANAVSIILMHNHPSGDCTPSRQDIEITKRLVEAGNLLGVDVLDHIIIGDRYSSLKEKGYL
jgi:DNA repair protein RadC